MDEVLALALAAVSDCDGLAPEHWWLRKHAEIIKIAHDAALKREPNNVLAPGEHKPGEIAGPTNDTRESARVESAAIGQVDCASEEQVSNPVEGTNKREPNAAGRESDGEIAHAMSMTDDGPAPAAPDVAEVVAKINAQFEECCAMGGHWDRMRDVALETAALLANSKRSAKRLTPPSTQPSSPAHDRRH